ARGRHPEAERREDHPPELVMEGREADHGEGRGRVDETLGRSLVAMPLAPEPALLGTTPLPLHVALQPFVDAGHDVRPESLPAGRHTTYDWMELERERGISITTSVMQFDYAGRHVNLLDTPGHSDFSEDTYRTLAAADAAVMLIDSAKGVEPQTIKLFQVCRMRKLPIVTFVNKLDRAGRDPFDLLDEIEKVLGMPTSPITWPIGQGQDF